MPTFDVVLHTNSGMFRENAPQLMASFPPVKDRIELGQELWVGRLEADLANALMDTCEPKTLGVLAPVRQFAQFYAYGRNLDGGAALHQWDADLRLQRCVALSRLVHPTAVGFRYAARIWSDPASESLRIIPGELYGISVDAFLPASHVRDWLTNDEVQRLGQLLAASETLQQPAFPPRVSRALWYFDYAQRTYYADLRWTLVATALEALVHTGKYNSTRQFTNRVPALASEVGMNPLTISEAGSAWDFRSRLSHGDGFLFALPQADISLYDKLEETLRLAILKAFVEPAFASVFTSDAGIDGRWPI